MNQIPKRLRKGDCIGIIAPSSGLAAIFPHRLEQGIQMLENMGFCVKLGKHASGITGYTSGSIQDRIDDIHEMFHDSEVTAIISMIGGNHSNQLLKHIDFDLIRENPKIFIGYSDITVLHYAFFTQANLRTYYGPCIMTQFGEYPAILDYTQKYFEKALMQDDVIGEIEASITSTDELLNWVEKEDMTRARIQEATEGYIWIRPGFARAPIIGGCIPSVNHLLGTRYWISPEEKIFFIDLPEGASPFEGLSIADLDTYLADLDNAGLFTSIAGLIIGNPYQYTAEQKTQLFELIQKYTKDTTYPILYNVNIGHKDPIITLPFGANCILDSKKNSFSITSH